MKPHTGVLLINLGTPDSPEVPDVRKYLREFLMDGRVIDIPFWQRFLLINLIIAPFRAKSSSEEYKKLWTPKGSPLLFHGVKIRELLQESLGPEYRVVFGMRYQSPSIRQALDECKIAELKKLIVIPLYPQYASASTGSTIEKVMAEVKRDQVLPRIDIVSHFPDYPPFIKAFAEIGKEYMARDNYDHILFSYHGLPERQIRKGSTSGYCQLSSKCCSVYHEKNHYCYRGQCHQTTRVLAEALGIEEKDYTICFQSRLGKDPWIKPYTDAEIERLAKEGKKRILAFSPSFVADCLETTVEIGESYNELFIEHGGEKLDLVESLNDHPLWVECLKEMVIERQPQLVG